MAKTLDNNIVAEIRSAAYNDAISMINNKTYSTINLYWQNINNSYCLYLLNSIDFNFLKTLYYDRFHITLKQYKDRP